MKRLICLLLTMLLTLSLVACDVADSIGTEPLDNQTQNNGGTQNNDGTSSNNPKEPELVMPDAPAEGLSMMEYNPAYETLEEITAEFSYASFPSTSEITVNSVTEFSKQEQADAYIRDFANLGYTTNFSYTVQDGYRNFFIANAEYNKLLPLQPQKVFYNPETDTVYIMLGYWFNSYTDTQLRPNQSVEVANNSVASYSIIGIKTDKNDAEHIVFVAPKTELCREDINVSVVSYDEKYMNYQHFAWNDNAVGVSTYSYPSTKVPAENNVDLITSVEQFKVFQDEYNDIVNRENDWTIMEYGIMYHKHGSNGLKINTDTDALLNLLVSSSELDAYSAVRHGQPRIVTGVDNSGKDITTMCSAFYDEATQTVYIYLEYNGQPHTQYESRLDTITINEKTKATYVAMSVRFDETMMDKVQNVVIVLPDPATVPSN